MSLRFHPVGEIPPKRKITCGVLGGALTDVLMLTIGKIAIETTTSISAYPNSVFSSLRNNLDLR